MLDLLSTVWDFQFAGTSYNFQTYSVLYGTFSLLEILFSNLLKNVYKSYLSIGLYMKIGKTGYSYNS